MTMEAAVTKPQDSPPQVAGRAVPAPPARRRGSGLLRQVGGRALPLVAALCGIVAVWYFVSYVVMDPSRQFLLPPPHRVVENALLESSVMSPMIDALGRTVRVALVGLAISVGLGMLQAIVMVQSGLLEKILYPYAVILQTIPILALVPLIGIWFGYDFTGRVIVCVIIALFPMIANTLFGLQSASQQSHDLFTLNRATRWQRLVKLQLPAALPSIFTGLRNAAGLSVIGAIVGDTFFRQGPVGIGGLLDLYTARVEMEALMVAIGLTAVFGVAVFSVFAALDRAVVGKWYGLTRQ